MQKSQSKSVKPDVKAFIATTMIHRHYTLETLHDGEWKPYGDLAIFPDSAYINQAEVSNFKLLQTTNSVSFGDSACHKGRVYFSGDAQACLGTLQTPGRDVLQVRGHLTEMVFSSERSAKGENNFQQSDDFTFGTDWSGDGPHKTLKPYFKLGGQDVSDRTVLTDIDLAGNTTIEMLPSSRPLAPGDSFIIVIPIDDSGFTGTYTNEDGDEFDWIGKPKAHAAAARRPQIENFAHLTSEASKFAALNMVDDDDDLDVMGLLSVSSIYATEINGELKSVDQAQVQAGKYFQGLMLNALDDQWIDDFVGKRVDLPDDVTKLMTEEPEFYNDKAILNLGQMLNTAFKADPQHKDIIAKISDKKMDEAWASLGKDKVYGKHSSKLYVQGYHDAVTSIQPYLHDTHKTPKEWAAILHEHLTSDAFLAMFSLQVGSARFKNVREQMYEWFVQVSVLDPDNKDLAQDVLAKTFAVVVSHQFSSLQWDDSIRPFLEHIIKDIVDGTSSILDDDTIAKQEMEEMRSRVSELVGMLGSTIKVADQLFAAFALAARNSKNRNLSGIVDLAAENLQRDSNFANIFKGGKTNFKAVLGSIAYGAAAGFFLFNLISSAEEDQTPERIVSEINLGLASLGAIIGATEKLMTTSLGNWFAREAAPGANRITVWVKQIGKWFTKEGTEVSGPIKAIFTRSAEEFLAKRLGPALALFGIAIAAWSLADDIMKGDVQNIVFDSLNTAFALADAVVIGVELFTAAATFPIGIAIAVVGLLVGLIQFLVNLFNPPPPQPDPVKDFVDGPLASAGYTV